MTDETKTELQQKETAAFDDDLRDEALDRQAESAASARCACSCEISAPPGARFDDGISDEALDRMPLVQVSNYSRNGP
jgi:hypothetical protein